jgi:hypothetical protein
MKSRLLAVAIVFALIAAALLVPRLFTSDAPERPTPATAPDPAMGSGGLSPVEIAEPKEQPPLALPAVPAPVRVLLVAEEHRSYTAWLEQLWHDSPNVRWRAWYASAPPDGIATHSEGETALAGPPAASDVDEAQVLVVAPIDPARLPEDTWRRIASRVREGALGVLLVPDHRYGAAMAQIPALRGLTPVDKSLPVEPVTPGGPVRGVHSPARGLTLAPAGATHPAARLLDLPGWNQKVWAKLGSDKGPWTTKFVSPVGDVVPGAKVLARVGSATDGEPALIAASDDERVLWAGGFFDLADAAYRPSESILAMRALVTRWIVWLASGRS